MTPGTSSVRFAGDFVQGVFSFMRTGLQGCDVLRNRQGMKSNKTAPPYSGQTCAACAAHTVHHSKSQEVRRCSWQEEWVHRSVRVSAYSTKGIHSQLRTELQYSVKRKRFTVDREGEVQAR